MFRSIMAIICGLITAMGCVMIYQLVLLGILVFTDPSWSDEELRAQYLSGELMPPAPGNLVLVFTLAMDSLCAAIGTFALVKIARRKYLLHAAIMAGIMTVGSVLSIGYDTGAGLPLWLPIARLILLPIAIIGVAILCQRCCGPPIDKELTQLSTPNTMTESGDQPQANLTGDAT